MWHVVRVAHTAEGSAHVRCCDGGAARRPRLWRRGVEGGRGLLRRCGALAEGFARWLRGVCGRGIRCSHRIDVTITQRRAAQAQVAPHQALGLFEPATTAIQASASAAAEPQRNRVALGLITCAPGFDRAASVPALRLDSPRERRQRDESVWVAVAERLGAARELCPQHLLRRAVLAQLSEQLAHAAQLLPRHVGSSRREGRGRASP
eukprot:764961-Prymnesium_polylepis.1